MSWSLTGAACVPAGQTAAGTGTFNSAGDVGFPAGRLGEIIVTCPVPSSLPRLVAMAVTYRDTDGPGPLVRLRAALRRKLRATGAVSDLAVFDSNERQAASANVRIPIEVGEACHDGAIELDHGSFTYYVEVSMTKRSRLQNVLLVSVDLGTALDC